MIKFYSSRLFLPENKLMFGNWLEYVDMEAFKVCDVIWQKNGEEFAKKHGELFSNMKFAPIVVRFSKTGLREINNKPDS